MIIRYLVSVCVDGELHSSPYTLWTLLLQFGDDLFYLLASGFQRCLLSSTLVSAGWCIVLPGMPSSLLIIVGCECAPGLLVCITPVQLAAKLQCGLIVSMRFRSDRSCPPFSFLGGWQRRSKLADLYTSYVLGFYSDSVEMTSLLGFFLDFFFFLFGTTRLFLSMSRLFLKDTVYCFFLTKQHQPLAVSDGSLTVH